MRSAGRQALVPRQQLAGGEIYPALEKGTIDAAEWVGPYDDQKLGFNKVAQFYYYPGWWEGGPQLSNFINLAKWNELPKSYQAVVEAASAKAHTQMLAKYDAQNPKALRELIAAGTKLMPFPQPVMEASYGQSIGPANAPSRRPTMIVAQEPTQSLTAPNRSLAAAVRVPRKQQDVALALVISLGMEMFDILAQRPSQRALAEQDHLRQALLLDRPHPAFRVGIQVRALCR